MCNKRAMENTKYAIEALQVVVGGVILRTIDAGNGNFGLWVKAHGKEFHVWIDRDPEGNGPGWVSVVEA